MSSPREYWELIDIAGLILIASLSFCIVAISIAHAVKVVFPC